MNAAEKDRNLNNKTLSYPACMGNGVYQLYEFADCKKTTHTETQYKVKTNFCFSSCMGILLGDGVD
jgi:hypothetical protein